MEVLKSELDQSVNFVERHLEGFLESRYVRRSPDYFVCYLSSHTGCKMGCQFCHLTATRQTSFQHSTARDYLDQVDKVFEHYRKEPKAKIVHFSFMARGEALSNSTILSQGDKLLVHLAERAWDELLYPKFCISTIMPKGVQSLTDIFGYMTPTIYYSLYSMDESWRKKWMPAAIPVLEALDILKDYQDKSKKIVKIHFPFIKGENDDFRMIRHMGSEIEKRKLLCEFNLVRYNPYSKEQGEESDSYRIKLLMDHIGEFCQGRVKEIKRVGFDVKASCGMFVQ